MEPKLVNRKILRKLLKKTYNDTSENNIFNKFFKTFKTHWHTILIIFIFFFIMISLYIDYQNKKHENVIKNESLKNIKNHQSNQFIDSYESEYYKMMSSLPRTVDHQS